MPSALPLLMPLIGLLFICFFIFYRLHKLSEICDKNLLVLLWHSAGDGEFFLAPKEENSVSLPCKDSGTKTWIISDLNTITVSYPIGSGMRLLKRDIQLVILDDYSWMPLVNRSRGEIPVPSPKLLGTIINEKITAAIVALGQDITKVLNKAGGSISLMTFLLGIIALAAGIIYDISLARPISEQLTTVISKLDTLVALLGGK